jgi:hypothetical protein
MFNAHTDFIHDTFVRAALLVCNSGVALAFAAAAHAQTALAPAYPMELQNHTCYKSTFKKIYIQ